MMKEEGGCYCGAVRYRIHGPTAFHGQCHCRECQYFTGGQANMIIGLPPSSFEFLQGEDLISEFRRSDLEQPVTRQFCRICGTPLWTVFPEVSPLRMLKAGTLDNPDAFGPSQMAVCVADKRAYHTIPDGIPAFEGMPPSE